jgi:hypothetical protein
VRKKFTKVVKEVTMIGQKYLKVNTKALKNNISHKKIGEIHNLKVRMVSLSLQQHSKQVKTYKYILITFPETDLIALNRFKTLKSISKG